MSHLDSVTAVLRVLVDRRSCAPCLASSTDLALDVIGDVIERLLKLGAATIDIERCRGCDRTVAVYRVTDPGTPSVPADP